MKNESEVNFAKALKKLLKGRSIICDALPDIQKTPILDNTDVKIISQMIDSMDHSICKLKKSYDNKITWNDE